MKKIDGGVTMAKGFYAAGAAAGIKFEGRDDMALVYSEKPAVTAGVFTTNLVKAAPVKWDSALVHNYETARAVVLNAGIANACTGKEGIEINEEMAQAVAEQLGIPAVDVLTASTGVIGVQVPLEPIKKGAVLLKQSLSDSKEAGERAAKAIMTTDTMKKECAVTFEVDGKTVTVGGMSKGSGMIHPNMATMLAVITTDIAMKKELLQEAIAADVKKSFNMISVDRDTSTNDTYVILANGMAENEVITEKNEAYKQFCRALNKVTTTLARTMAGDGEGASHLLEVTVENAKTHEDAVILSKSVISSNLVKTALYGADANWGRILCALGYAGVFFQPEKVDLTILSKAGSLKLVEDGCTTGFSEDIAKQILLEEEVTVIVDLKLGIEEATAWGCDLTYDYVKINGDYRS
ncbi:glutamate N-acetyltransferase [Lachnospiraceae bacterium KM106-2]|nr:glutamate N-acetyltransferase [Lachnospiraceae bacterium KM106-2]